MNIFFQRKLQSFKTATLAVEISSKAPQKIRDGLKTRDNNFFGQLCQYKAEEVVEEPRGGLQEVLEHVLVSVCPYLTYLWRTAENRILVAGPNP